MDMDVNFSNKHVDIKQNEINFQIAFDNYWHTDVTKHNDKYYSQQMENMWTAVYNACANLCKGIYKERGVIVDDLDEIIMDSTIYCMCFITGDNRRRKLYRPRALKSFCYLRCRKFIDDPKRQWYEKNVTQMPEDNYREVDMEIECDV